VQRFPNFTPSGDSFEVREFSSALLSALGLVALSRAVLENQVVAKIHLLRDAEGLEPDFLPDYSLRKKMDILRELIATAERQFNVGSADGSEFADELIRFLIRADRVSRDVVDPELHGLHLRREVPKGLPGYVMDIADYVTNADIELEQFFFCACQECSSLLPRPCSSSRGSS
jgi:hypothetical protein